MFEIGYLDFAGPELVQPYLGLVKFPDAVISIGKDIFWIIVGPRISGAIFLFDFECLLSLSIPPVQTFTVSCWVIRTHQPPTVRLIETDTHKSFRSSSVRPDGTARPITPAPRPSSTEPDFLATLSLSSKPIISPVNPVFGLPSLPLSQPSITPVDEDAMDWIPSHASSQHSQAQQADNNLWLRPQRFFAPEKPTGLEGLFERALLVNDEPQAEIPPSRTTHSVMTRHLSTWWWVYLLSLAPVCGVLYKNWSK